MKISLNWLRDFVTLKETDPQAIAGAVTECIAEVDGVEAPGALLKDVVVGKVLTLARHPNADRLSLCGVQTDRGVKRVVCGGTNLREGMRVAFAHAGARVRGHGKEMVTLENAKV
ncbi:MAG: phenylalanine--tRNA ligase subunit beta, partial [Patescibacteria group bacterium]